MDVFRRKIKSRVQYLGEICDLVYNNNSFIGIADDSERVIKYNDKFAMEIVRSFDEDIDDYVLIFILRYMGCIIDSLRIKTMYIFTENDLDRLIDFYGIQMRKKWYPCDICCDVFNVKHNCSRKEICPISKVPIVIKKELECKHSFEKNYIDTWLQNNKECPVCRKAVLPK